MFKKQAYHKLLDEVNGNATVVAVSKMRSVKDIREAYDAGVRDFGENYVQELLEKQPLLPGDIRWHFIGHLQRNKVKYIAPFVHLIHGVDSTRLLEEINKQGIKNNRIIPCLLQVHIAQEETKFGFDADELKQIDPSLFKGARISGMMGMASFSDDPGQVREEFKLLKRLFDEYSSLAGPSPVLSMGMSGDYKLALEEGSNMLRIGSALFGVRN